MRRSYYVYIVASRYRTLYVGVTNDLRRRIDEHRSRSIPGFTAKYHASRLVYFEEFDDPQIAIDREKQIKSWRRAKKTSLIEATNPRWIDLASPEP